MTAVRALRVVPITAPQGKVAGRPGADVLNDVSSFVARFNVFPSEHCVPTLALWYAHTHMADRFYVTPRLILDSAEPGSGKTRVLEVAQFLVNAPEMTISAKPAALFRLVQAGPITILFDEVDTIFNPKTSGNGDNDDLRAMLNVGYKRSATIPRCVGDVKSMQVKRFKVYAPAVLAGIAGGMPATITTRAITIHMRRRRPDERVDQFREKVVEREAAPIRDALTTWVNAVTYQVADAEPEMPPGVTDRSAEIWEPLIALADAAGGHWPDTARNACRHFVLDAGPQAGSLGVRLLADLRELYTTHDADRLTTADILAALVGLDETPWPDLYGKPLDARRLARELGRYGVKPVTFETDSGSAKGYVTFGTTGKQAQSGLSDAWARYLPPEISNPSKSDKQTGQPLTDTPPLTDPVVTANRSVIP
jgi:Protein of unknown function (DUF3631)